MIDTGRLVTEVSKKLVDDGKLIEAGFVAMRATVIARDAPTFQISEMRMAFFAGAQHLFGTIMNILDPGSEPTARDLRRMDSIQKELDAFIKEFALRSGPTKGAS